MDHRRDIVHELTQRFGTLSPEGLSTFSDLLIPLRVTKGTKILRKGEVCKYIYFIEKGLLRQCYEKNGKQLTEHIGYEGSIIMCIESLFRHEASRLTIEALEPSTLYAIPFDEYLHLTHSSYEFCAFLMNIYKESLILSQKKADTLRFETAKERYLRTLRDHPDIIRRAPLHIVASYLQMTPETLSRVRTATNKLIPKTEDDTGAEKNALVSEL